MIVIPYLPQNKRSLTWVLGLLLLLGISGCMPEQSLQRYLMANQNKLGQAVRPEAAPQLFVVEPGTPARLIGQQLTDQGFIGDARLFEAYVRVNGLDNRLEAGRFSLSPAMTIPEIAAALQNAQKPGLSITLPEGWRLEQVADYLNKTGTLDGEIYRSLAQSSQGTGVQWDDYPFLIGRPAGSSLEGYLFPATYELPAENPQAADLLQRQLDAFAQQVLPHYNQYVEKTEPPHRLDLYAILTLASIVEREAVVAEERPAIAQVYLNRLAAGMKLDADPTVQYAIGYQPATDQWWKTPVFLEEYAGVDSPYNTYLHPGIPPGPIASPGLASIQAVLDPEKHDYLYFVALPDRSGGHVFSRTFEEHLENVRRYQNQ